MNDEELTRTLHEAWPAPLPPALARRVHAGARTAFERAGGRAARVAGVAATTGVVTAVAIYLAWAVQFLCALASG